MSHGRQLEGNEYDWYKMFVTSRAADEIYLTETTREEAHYMQDMSGSDIVVQYLTGPGYERDFLNIFTPQEWIAYRKPYQQRVAMQKSDYTPSGIQLIARERERQKEELGYDEEHDSFETNQELAVAAGLYALDSTYAGDVLDELSYNLPDEGNVIDSLWPWKDLDGNNEHDKRGKLERIRQLAIAGALIAAEIDRLQVKEQ